MIAILMTDWEAWLKKGSAQTLTVLIGGLALTSGLTFFRPEAILEFFLFFVIWLGFKLGKQSWEGIEIWAWVGRGGFSPARAVMGKVLWVAFLLLFHGLVAVPGFLITAMVWGVPWTALGWALLSSLMAIEVAAMISMLIHLLRPDNRYLHGFLVSAWLLSTAMLPAIRGANPFVQIWTNIIPAVASSRIYWVFNLLLLAGVGVAIGRVLRKEVSYHVAQSGPGISD